MLQVVLHHPDKGTGFFNTQYGDEGFYAKINQFYDYKVVEVQATDEELDECFMMLGRRGNGRSVYTFVGESAQEIITNWK